VSEFFYDSIGDWGDPQNKGNGLAYCGNNPVNCVDPFGNLSISTKRWRDNRAQRGGEGWLAWGAGLLGDALDSVIVIEGSHGAGSSSSPPSSCPSEKIDSGFLVAPGFSPEGIGFELSSGRNAASFQDSMAVLGDWGQISVNYLLVASMPKFLQLGHRLLFAYQSGGWQAVLVELAALAPRGSYGATVPRHPVRSGGSASPAPLPSPSSGGSGVRVYRGIPTDHPTYSGLKDSPLGSRVTVSPRGVGPGARPATLGEYLRSVKVDPITQQPVGSNYQGWSFDPDVAFGFAGSRGVVVGRPVNAPPGPVSVGGRFPFEKEATFLGPVSGEIVRPGG